VVRAAAIASLALGDVAVLVVTASGSRPEPNPRGALLYRVVPGGRYIQGQPLLRRQFPGFLSRLHRGRPKRAEQQRRRGLVVELHHILAGNGTGIGGCGAPPPHPRGAGPPAPPGAPPAPPPAAPPSPPPKHPP